MDNPIYFVSDNHFQKRNDDFEKERRLKFYSLLEHIKANKGSLVIAGDFFDFWFEYKGYVPYEYLDIFEKLKELKDSGSKIHYVLGNHDYWDFGFFKKVFAEKIYKDEYHIIDENSKTLVIHGDGILKEDSGYRLFRKIIRSKLCILLYKIFPPKIGYYIASKITHADKPDSYYRDSESLKVKLTEYAEHRWNQFDTVLIGHYHQCGIIDKNGKKLIFLGDWLSKNLVTVYENGVWSQMNWKK